MGKPVFRVLTISQYYVKKEDTKVKRTTKIPNTRQPDGTGVPPMPRFNHSNVEAKSSCCSDPVEMVKKHLITQHGQTEGMRRLKVMSGMDVVTLADRLKKEASDNTTKIARKEGNYEEYSAPKMRW